MEEGVLQQGKKSNIKVLTKKFYSKTNIDNKILQSEHFLLRQNRSLSYYRI